MGRRLTPGAGRAKLRLSRGFSRDLGHIVIPHKISLVTSRAERLIFGG